jgi:hypothetical protein
MTGPSGLAGHLGFRFSFNLAIKAAIKAAKRSWRAILAAGFAFLINRECTFGDIKGPTLDCPRGPQVS